MSAVLPSLLIAPIATIRPSSERETASPDRSSNASPIISSPSCFHAHKHSFTDGRKLGSVVGTIEGLELEDGKLLGLKLGASVGRVELGATMGNVEGPELEEGVSLGLELRAIVGTTEGLKLIEGA